MSDVLVRLGSSLVEKFSMAFIEVEFHGDNPCQTPKSKECSKQGAIKKQIPLNKNSTTSEFPEGAFSEVQ